MCQRSFEETCEGKRGEGADVSRDGVQTAMQVGLRAGRSVSSRSLRAWYGLEKVLPKSVGSPRAKTAY